MRLADRLLSSALVAALAMAPAASHAADPPKSSQPNWKAPNLKEATSGTGRKSQRDRRDAERTKREANPKKAAEEGGKKEGEAAKGKDAKKPAPAQGGQPAAATKEAKPAAKAPAGGGVKTAEFSLAATPEHAMLRLTGKNDIDATDVDAVEGSEFVTDVRLTNPKSRPIDRIRLVIDYSPAYTEPIAINDSAIAANFASTPVARVDRSLGQIFYEVELAKPIVEPKTPIVFISWNALKPVSFTNIRFARTRDGQYSEIYEKGEKALGAAYDDGDGTVSLGLTIIPADPAEALVMQEDPNLYLGSDERVGGVLLAIEPPKKTPRVGEPFSMDIVFDNTAFSQLDGLSMMIQYDPTTLTVLDADKDNWITLGTNIHDGATREKFPWDYHMANAVHQPRGTIEYRAGSSYPDKFVGTGGVIARIYAVATKPSAGTPVRFIFARGEGQRTTTVTYLGQDVLGDVKVRNDGVKGALFPVLPAAEEAAEAKAPHGEGSL